jgi:formimidoylglutamate deiminase
MSERAGIRNYTGAQVWGDSGWQAEVTLGVDADGQLIDAIGAGATETLGQWVLPGMPNLHSHAFQRAMAGLAERRGKSEDSFWSWRETMYAFAATIGPDELQAIAAQLYL